VPRGADETARPCQENLKAFPGRHTFLPAALTADYRPAADQPGVTDLRPHKRKP